MDFFSQLRPDDFLIDGLPDDVAATVEVRDAQLQALSFGGALGLEFIVSDLRRWPQDKVIRVGFLDGDSDLHGDIQQVVEQISSVCGLAFDFGKMAGGSFRRWSESDTEYAADIRVSFNKK